MRYIVLALALCFAVPPISAVAAKKPARFNVKHAKVKHPKAKTIKRHSRGH